MLLIDITNISIFNYTTFINKSDDIKIFINKTKNFNIIFDHLNLSALCINKYNIIIINYLKIFIN